MQLTYMDRQSMSKQPKYGDVIEVRIGEHWYRAKHLSDAMGRREFFFKLVDFQGKPEPLTVRYSREGKDWRWPTESDAA
jgi:hypothetical protein